MRETGQRELRVGLSLATRSSCSRSSLSRSRAPAHRRGFTLIELLVVVAIIAMLLAVLMPSLSRAKEQAKAVKCLAHLRELGHGMLVYYDEWGNYPAHQWRLPDNSRIRWFNAMADALAGLEVQSCPATEWEVGRNNSYGYNYKYVGSVRDNARAVNPWRPYECFPVRHLQAPSKTIAFADCDGTGWKLEWGPERTEEHPDADHDPDRLGNHGYLVDPRKAYEDNSLWNGLRVPHPVSPAGAPSRFTRPAGLVNGAGDGLALERSPLSESVPHPWKGWGTQSAEASWQVRSPLISLRASPG